MRSPRGRTKQSKQRRTERHLDTATDRLKSLGDTRLLQLLDASAGMSARILSRMQQ
jgi:hypothetical protein